MIDGSLCVFLKQEWKRSGQIPAFGNWDFANEMPITQYFESARQAGLIRYSSSSGESDPYIRGDHDLYAVDFKKPVRNGTHSTLRKVLFFYIIFLFFSLFFLVLFPKIHLTTL